MKLIKTILFVATFWFCAGCKTSYPARSTDYRVGDAYITRQPLALHKEFGGALFLEEPEVYPLSKSVLLPAGTLLQITEVSRVNYVTYTVPRIKARLHNGSRLIEEVSLAYISGLDKYDGIFVNTNILTEVKMREPPQAK